jgi:beta-carotene 3-hydroxylase
MRARLLAGVGSFVAMEPVTYAAHRWVMHGVGWVAHRSHHEGRITELEARAGALEANDAFPCIFATVTVLAMAAGSHRSSLRALLSVGCGVTAYGVAYGLVHDIYIHARLGRPPRLALLERLKEAHRFHHLYGGEPYGMLCPIVPARVRALAAS